MRLVPLALLLAATLALAQPGSRSPALVVPGPPEVGTVERHVEEVYYDVAGETAGELARSLRARGPASEGQRFFGLTEWEVNAEYRWVGRATGCSVEDLTVRLAVTVQLPRWRPPLGASRPLRQAWRAFEAALAEHEAGHVRLADEAAEAIRWRLASFRTPTCEDAEAAARQAVGEIIEVYASRNDAFDRETRHGGTTGAAWPPPSEPAVGPTLRPRR